MTKTKSNFPFAEAAERYRYEPDSGRLFLKKHRRYPSLNEREISGLDAHGYVQINAKPYGQIKGHRLAWLLHYGEWPAGHIDHVNGVKDDNRIENLRVVTNAVNCQNKRMPLPANKSGFLGVSLHSQRPDGSPRWAATVTLNRKTHHLGFFSDPAEAHAAYVACKRKLHEGCTL